MRALLQSSYTRNRATEWEKALIMLGMAFLLYFFPRSIELSSFRSMTTIGLTSAIVGTIFGIVGIFRVVALIANGQSLYWGPRIRFCCALIGAFFWFSMALALVQMTHLTGQLSPGIPVYVVLVLSEIHTCARTRKDALRAIATATINNSSERSASSAFT